MLLNLNKKEDHTEHEISISADIASNSLEIKSCGAFLNLDDQNKTELNKQLTEMQGNWQKQFKTSGVSCRDSQNSVSDFMPESQMDKKRHLHLVSLFQNLMNSLYLLDFSDFFESLAAISLITTLISQDMGRSQKKRQPTKI